MRALIRERATKAGAVTYQVRWRENGRQTSASFDDPAIGQIYKQIIDSDGSAAADAWLERRLPTNGDGAEIWTLDRVMEHHIEHLTGISVGTREKYTKDYARTWSAIELDRFGRMGAMPVEVKDASLAGNRGQCARVDERRVSVMLRRNIRPGPWMSVGVTAVEG